MKRKVSYSRLRLHSRCAYKYWLQYEDLERLPTPKGLWSPLGNAVHETIKENLIAKKAGIQKDHHGLRAAEAFDRLLQENEYTTPEGENPEVAVGSARSMAMKLAELHASKVAPNVYPYLIEERWVIDRGDYELTVIIDILERWTVGEGYSEDGSQLEVLRLRDTKTTNKDPAEAAASRSLQLLLYADAVREVEGVTPALAVMDFLMKRQRPVHKQSAVAITDEMLKPVELHIEAFLQALEAGSFPPISPDDWRCSQKHCEYFDVCRYALRPSTFSGFTQIVP